MSNSNKKTCATIICNGRPVLSRRAKCLVKLLKGLVPDDVLAYVECELCAETRYHQNQLVDEIFAILIDSCKIRINDDSRLAMKENELARMLISYINPLRSDYE